MAGATAPTNVGDISEALHKYGAAPGASDLMVRELKAAEAAIQSGIYTTCNASQWRHALDLRHILLRVPAKTRLESALKQMKSTFFIYDWVFRDLHHMAAGRRGHPWGKPVHGVCTGWAAVYVPELWQDAQETHADQAGQCPSVRAPRSSLPPYYVTWITPC